MLGECGVFPWGFSAMANQYATQEQLGELFKRSQSWISRRQHDAGDPMPRDLAGAADWGRRRGFIAVQTSAPAGPAPMPANVVAEVALKDMRREKLSLEVREKRGDLVSREEVEAREIQACAEFRQAAEDYPRKARAIIERFVPDAAVVEKIFAELQPLAAELLNKADPVQVLAAISKDEARAALIARVDEILQSW